MGTPTGSHAFSTDKQALRSARGLVVGYALRLWGAGLFGGENQEQHCDHVGKYGPEIGVRTIERDFRDERYASRI